MKLAALFSGGKDSTYAMYKAQQYGHKISVLISVVSQNPESYMFHTPNIHLTELQAQAIEIPLLTWISKGEKERELQDLKAAMYTAKEQYGIEGVVTGAVESIYQASRVQRICHELDLWCFNPLWLKDQKKLLQELLENKFEVIIGGVFAPPLDGEWLGRKLDAEAVKELIRLEEEFHINPAGEGGEIETFVTDAPFFRKKIEIKKATKNFKGKSGTYDIEGAGLVEK